MRKTGLLIVLLICAVVKAQPPKRFYTKFGLGGVDIGYSVKQTLENNYIVAGSTTSQGNGNSDFYLLKIDSMGSIMWQKTYGGFSNDVARSVIQLQDSGYVIGGFTNSFGNGGYDALIIRTDKLGNKLWQKTWGGADWDFLNDLTLSSDGSIVACGSTYSFGNGKSDGFVMKYDLNGNFIWEKFFGGLESDDLNSIISTNDNNLAVVGCNRSIHDLTGDCFFAKLKNDGDTLFTRYYGGPYKDWANDVVQKTDNDFVIGGTTTFSTSAYSRSLMYSITSSGAPVWNNTNYFGPINDEEWRTIARSLKKPDYIAYVRNDQIPSFKQQNTVFYSPSPGNGEITNSNGGYEDEIIHDIQGTKDGGFVSVGVTYSFGSENGDIWFMKHDSTIVNYSNAVGVSENKIEETKIFMIKEKSKIYIAENINANLFDKVTVYDINGKIVKQIISTNETQRIDMSEFSNSVYLIMFSKKNTFVYKIKLIND